ncbi:uncharacterized protein EI97DRAFT_432021 [Westerdykella ornata]|uniref:Inactive metallocarboxypeptidase ECM14 n=1 Tax=Westerdykella ornata TaxID=318751 RepID=A0A6A6JPU2_WESOR|nr:uncharacterized protein EI97DRAFT_432021 [Westerdykella ornata]KAF2277928.1 hypothetical protein EI97DRAFT_432021 [Westerdykella ornata]
MRPPSFALVSLLFLSPTLIAAAPHPDTGSAASYDRPPSSWRRLSTAIIEKICGRGEAQKILGTHSHGIASSNGGAAEGKLFARYGHDMVMRFKITSAEEASALAEAVEVLFLDVWEFNDDWVDIRIAQDVVPSLMGLLPDSLQKSHVPLMRDLDLAHAILDSYPTPSGTQPHDTDRSFSPRLMPSSQSKREHPFFQDYQPLNVIVPWMDLMASMFSTHVRKINVGISYEGRDIPALRVGVHPTNDEQKQARRKTILITGGSHAREWISTSTVNYIAWSLINSYGKVRSVSKMLEAFDFVFVPTLNPDGYVYSWETDRLWRKNRQPTSLRFCHGIDLDRAYSFKWNGNTTHSNPCSESYAGDAPFDGVEAQRFAEWAKNETENNNVEFLGLFDMHSYSQQILYPYSYTCEHDPPTVEDLEELGLGLAKAIRTSRKGHSYKVTSACEGNVALQKNPKGKDGRIVFPRIESTGGSALDWFYHDLGVKYAYQIKLRDTGSYGFLLPRENIVPTGEELLEAVLYFGHFVLGEVGFSVEEPELVRPEEAAGETAEMDSSDEMDEAEDPEGQDTSLFELRRRR